jgi:CubicO group peptidase (beta-lactamase class C family)
MTALTALLVADRGELEFEAPVARYWPGFAAGGKGRVTVAQLMSYSAGLCGWREPITRDAGVTVPRLRSVTCSAAVGGAA